MLGCRTYYCWYLRLHGLYCHGISHDVGVCSRKWQVLVGIHLGERLLIVEGMPGSKYLSRVSTFSSGSSFFLTKSLSQVEPRKALPTYSILLTSTIISLLALINIGSTTAFNAFAGLTVQGFYSVFIISASVLLHKRLTTRRSEIRWGPFSLGPFGVPIIIFALAYSVIGFFFSFWPPLVHPPVDEFNWSMVVFLSVVIISSIYWHLRARHVYTGPIFERAVA